MIVLFPPDTEDFSTNGTCVLRPSSCKVTETLNGSWELTMEHPLDDDGKWESLQVGCILRAPVPANTTPAVNVAVETTAASTVEREIWKVSSPTNLLNLRTGTNQNTKRIGFYRNGKELEVLKKNVDGTHWYEVVGPDGKHGYVSSNYLTFVRKETVSTSKPVVTTSVVESRQLREQPFRIYSVTPSLNGVKVSARHIFYDLMDNMVPEYKPSGSVTGANAAKAILTACSSAHDFSVVSDITSTADELDYSYKNPVEIFMGDGGLIEKYSGEILRDWYDIFFLNRVGRSTSVTLRYKRDIAGISCSTDVSGIVTRIIPQGQDKDGKPLYLPEQYVDSPNINSYPHPKYYLLQVSDAKENDGKQKDSVKVTKDQVYAKLRKAAQEQFDGGCDLPDVSLSIDFININDTEEYGGEEYEGFRDLHNIFLGDGVTVIVEKLGLTTALRMTSYEYDCLLERYTKCTLGRPDEALAGQMISASQLASGSITGMKLALGSIGSGQLQSGSVGALNIKNAAIETAHIQQAAIETAHIQTAAITTAKIADATITSAKIADGAIQTAHIGDAVIGTAQIQEASITNEKVAYSAISSANIQNAAITTAKIADAAITDAHIADASISSAKIRDLNAQVAVIAQAVISQASITSAQIMDLSAQVADIVCATINTADIDWANISELTTAIASIVTARIGNADIGFAQVKDLVTGTSIITEGEAGKLFISRLAVDAMQVVSAVTNELMVKGEDDKYYRLTIENGAVVPVQEELDGGQIAANTIDGGTAIVEHSITASELNATNIFADEAIIRELSAGVATFGSVFAESGIIPYLESSIIRGNGELKLLVDSKASSDDLSDAIDTVNNSITQVNGTIGQMDGSIDRINNALARVDTAITQTAARIPKTYLQDDEPTSAKDGDTWINPSDNYKPKLRQNGDWQEVYYTVVDSMATQQMLNDEISSCVTSIRNLSNTQGITEAQMRSEIQQKADSVTTTFTTSINTAKTGLQSDILSAEERAKAFSQTLIRETARGIEVGKSDSTFKTLLSNNKLSFLQGEKEVAYISNNVLYITDAKILRELSLGENEADGARFYWKKTSTGLEFKYSSR